MQRGNRKLTGNGNKKKTFPFTWEQRIQTLHLQTKYINHYTKKFNFNSIKFTNQGGHIDISLKHDNANAIVTVSDNGIGISSERIETLFEISQVH